MRKLGLKTLLTLALASWHLAEAADRQPARIEKGREDLRAQLFSSAETGGKFSVGLLVENVGETTDHFYAAILLVTESCEEAGGRPVPNLSNTGVLEKSFASALLILPRGTASIWLQPYSFLDRSKLDECTFEVKVFASKRRLVFHQRISYRDLQHGLTLNAGDVPRLVSAERSEANGRTVIAILAPRMSVPWKKRLSGCEARSLEESAAVFGFDELKLNERSTLILSSISPGAELSDCKLLISQPSSEKEYSFGISTRATYMDMSMNPNWGYIPPPQSNK